MFQTGILDTVGRKILFFSIPLFFLISFFLSLDLRMKILFFSTFLFFLVFFFLASAWVRPKHPERYLMAGLLVSILHTFLFLFGGILGLTLALLISKISPSLSIYF